LKSALDINLELVNKSPLEEKFLDRIKLLLLFSLKLKPSSLNDLVGGGQKSSLIDRLGRFITCGGGGSGLNVIGGGLNVTGLSSR
jgi:hypothetical protein